MKNGLFIFLSLIFLQRSVAQQKNHQKVDQITKEEFNTHLPEFNFLSKPNKKIKVNGIIKIKTPKKNILLKDDGEMLEYRYEGDLKGTQLILIHKLEPNFEAYYFINRITGTIDTLIDRPIFYSNKMNIVCLEGAGTDVKQRIQIGKIQNRRFVTKAYFMLAQEILPDHVYWFNMNTLFIEANGNKDFYKLIF